MKIVLVRVTGRRSADEDPALAPLISQCAAAMCSNTEPRRTINYGWPSTGIGHRALADAERSAAVGSRTADDLCLAGRANGRPIRCRHHCRRYLRAETGGGRGGRASAACRCSGRAPPMCKEITWITPAVNPAAPSSLADMAGGWAAEGCSSAAPTAQRRTPNVRWTHLFQDRSSEYSGNLEGVNRTADLYAGCSPPAAVCAPIDIEVTGVGDLAGLRRRCRPISNR
jgi:hypothetical protein